MQRHVPFFFLPITLFLIACGENESSEKNPIVPSEESSSSSGVIFSSNLDAFSSSDEKKTFSSASVESHSNFIDEGSSSSKKNKESSSSSKKEKSSSSEIGSSDTVNPEANSSSENLEPIENTSSSKERSSSSSKTEKLSSSEIGSSDSVNSETSSSFENLEPIGYTSSSEECSSSIAESSSSATNSSSSSAAVLANLYDCAEYTCVTTKYLNPDIDYGEYLDVRDTQVYRTVQIGEQVWMAQNLNYKNDNQSFCFDSDTLYCKEKGRLYTWENALKVCPEGWHLPDSSEYNALIDFVEKNNNGLPTKKSLTSGTFNIFGFSIILGSGYVVRGEYSNEGGGNGNSYFWTASETDGLDSSRPPETFARARGIRTSSNALVKLSWEKIHALAVRCIQN